MRTPVRSRIFLAAGIAVALLGYNPYANAQSKASKSSPSKKVVKKAAVNNAVADPLYEMASEKLFPGLNYRLIGPWRGGRSAAVAASYTQKNTFYMGATGGGVWKTTDGGASWKNISDGFFGGTIGSVAVAPSDESVLYVGEGENTVRGNVSEGLKGVWKSTDGGRTWKNIGLSEGRHITRLIVHPKNPDIVWAAVLGHLFGPHPERGIFKTTDGGKTWKKVLYVNEQAGASDLIMEPGNPNLLYAGTWRVIRTPYSLESGGEGSGLWKSTDGGETWQPLHTAKGFPSGTWGITGITVSPANTSVLYALIEHEKGGLYRSEDSGESWTLQSNDNNIRQRAWYYTKLFADPKDENKVYVLNVAFMRTNDAGKSWQYIRTPHSDHHDLWIDPNDPGRMIVADDGGAQVSFNAGASWSTMDNQPTAQIYRVSTDNSFPYRILGAQQDNTTMRIRHRSYGGAIGETDWETTAGFESGYVVADPLNPDIVYGGNYGGYLSRLDHKTGENRNISVWPDVPIGSGADVLKYRFQWNFPIFFSPHNPKKLYAAGNHLFVTENGGASWTTISPDLTTNDKSKQVSSGGPITKDNTSVEYYCTIFTAAESALEKDLLWTGSDDGLVHISKDGGKSWNNVTPTDAPKWMMWNAIETDPFEKGTAYITGTRYKLDDFSPYIYKTSDYGKTWKRITSGIPNLHFTRVMRCDPKRPGLLYAGTEYGMYLSMNGGNSWHPFQLNLPEVPITDLTIKNNDLVVATQGRAFYILDDLSPLQQINETAANTPLQWITPRTAYRMAGYQVKNPKNAGMNPPNGVVLQYIVNPLSSGKTASMPTGDKSVLKILDEKGNLMHTAKTNSSKNPLSWKTGLNQWVWDMQDEPLERVADMILWNGVPGSIKAAPGNYAARFIFEGANGIDSTQVNFEVKGDPNYQVSNAEYQAQYLFLKEVKEHFKDIQQTVLNIRKLREQLNSIKARSNDEQWKALQPDVDSLVKKITAIEEQLHQTKAKSGQDVLNYPIRLNDKISGIFDAASSGNMAPPQQVVDTYQWLKKQSDAELKAFQNVLDNEVPNLNEKMRNLKVPFLYTKGQ